LTKPLSSVIIKIQKTKEIKIMNTYTIYLGSNPIACVAGATAAYACYEAAKALTEYTGKRASLVWDETGEEVAYCDPSEGIKEWG
jgi:hypothetical protein